MTKTATANDTRRGRPPERADLVGDEPVVLTVKIGKTRRDKLRRYAERQSLEFNGKPSMAQAVSKLIDEHA